MAFNDDIENINYYVYHNLKPFTRKSERRHIRLHISQSFFQFLKKEYKINGRFKPVPTEMINKFAIPDERLITPGKNSIAKRFEARVSMAKSNNFTSKPFITIRFIRSDRFSFD